MINYVECTVNHIAIIMDGNRRWSKCKNVDPVIGYNQGKRVLLDTIEECIAQKINYLVFYFYRAFRFFKVWCAFQF